MNFQFRLEQGGSKSTSQKKLVIYIFFIGKIQLDMLIFKVFTHTTIE